MKKTFDCVELQHRAGERVFRYLAGMTGEENDAYWRERRRLLREHQAELRAALETPEQGGPVADADAADLWRRLACGAAPYVPSSEMTGTTSPHTI